MAEIYCLIFPNGKRYVGQTCRTAQDRFYGHAYHSMRGHKNSAVAAAIRKYGPDDVKVETMWVGAGVGQDRVNEMEQLLISFLGTLSPGGYNLTTGGDHGGVMSDALKVKISGAIKQAMKAPAIRQKCSDAIQKALKDPEFRKKHRQKVIEAHNTPEYREYAAAAMRAKWENPEWRAKLIIKLREGQRRRHENNSL